MKVTTRARRRIMALSAGLGAAVALLSPPPAVLAQHHGHGGGGGGAGFEGSMFRPGGATGYPLSGGGVPAQQGFGGFQPRTMPQAQYQMVAPPQPRYQVFTPPQPNSQVFTLPQPHPQGTFAPHPGLVQRPQGPVQNPQQAIVHHPGVIQNPQSAVYSNAVPTHHPQGVAHPNPGQLGGSVPHPSNALATHTVLKPPANTLTQPHAAGAGSWPLVSNAVVKNHVPGPGRGLPATNVMPGHGPPNGVLGSHPGNRLAGNHLSGSSDRPTPGGVPNGRPSTPSGHSLHVANSLVGLHPRTGHTPIGIDLGRGGHLPKPNQGQLAPNAVVGGSLHRPAPGLLRPNTDLAKHLTTPLRRPGPTSRPGSHFLQPGKRPPLLNSMFAHQLVPGWGSVLAPLPLGKNPAFSTRKDIVSAWSVHANGLGPGLGSHGPKISGFGLGLSLGFGLDALGFGLGVNPLLGLGLANGSGGSGIGLDPAALSASPLIPAVLVNLGGGPLTSFLGLNPLALNSTTDWLLWGLLAQEVEIASLEALLLAQQSLGPADAVCSWSPGFGPSCPLVVAYNPPVVSCDSSSIPYGPSVVPSAAAGSQSLTYVDSGASPAGGGLTTIGGLTGVVQDVGVTSNPVAVGNSGSRGDEATTDPAKASETSGKDSVVGGPEPGTGEVVEGGPRLVLVNPKDSGGPVNYLLDGKPSTSEPGTSQTLSGQPSWLVEFDRGEASGQARYTLTEGTYTFTVTEKGWELYNTTFDVTLDNSSNPNDFHYVRGDRAEEVKAGRTQTLSGKFAIVVSFDQGDGGEPAVRTLDTGVYRVDLNPETNRLDLMPAGSPPSDDRPAPDTSGETRLVGSSPEDLGK
ncbi:MAG: hypothetical protein JOZ63_15825 [Planctomycetaceae bacterium]|nr:hypothetical protein [Planctomycetaceae bacterium]